jgi:hypothetical protein
LVDDERRVNTNIKKLGGKKGNHAVCVSNLYMRK